MTDAKEDYDDRSAALFDYGPLRYRQLRAADDSGGARPCPPVDYNDAAYSPWNILMSLRVLGWTGAHWTLMINYSAGPRVISTKGDGNDIYLTLLYKMNISPRDHLRHDRTVLSLHQGHLRLIFLEFGSSMIVTTPAITVISTNEAAYVSGPFYHYKLIALTDDGYFYHPSGNESPSDEEEEEDID